MDLHTIYAVDFDGTLIDQVVSQDITPNIEPILASGDGQVYPSFSAAGSISPRVTFSTTAVLTALTAVGVTGVAVAADALVTMYLQKYAEGGLRAGATSHLKMVASKGLLVPRRLSASMDGVTMEYELITVFDGTNAPIILTADQSLAGSPSTGELFVVGPVKINDVQLEGIQAIELDFGIGEIVRISDGQVYPTYVAIGSIAPTLTIETTEALALNTFGVDGTAQGATASEFYLRAVSPGGTRVINATASHIKIVNTASKGRISAEAVRGVHGDVVGTSIVIALTSSGTAHPLTITKGAAIPAGL